MTCAVCGRSFEVRRKDHRFCSAKCRLAGFQQTREALCRERNAQVRLLLTTVIEAATEAKALVTEPSAIP